MPGAELVLRTRSAVHGGFLEMAVWRLPEPVSPSEHRFKYRLVFARDGHRLVGYDNERAKGDHKHLRQRERAYRVVDVDTLIRDFPRDVERLKD